MRWSRREFVMSAWAAQEPLFRAETALVRVHAEVLGATGPLTQLERGDFLVFDNDRPQTLVHFSLSDEPLDLVLLFDVSGSMEASVREMAERAREALAELRRGDRVAVMTFHARTRLLAQFTDDLDAVERAVRGEVLRSRFGGETHLLAAVDEAARYFLKDSPAPRRRAVLIFTDNHGPPTKRESAVVRRMWEADAILCGLITRLPENASPVWQSRLLTPRAQPQLIQGIDAVVEQTGGAMLRAEQAGASFPAMMRRIRMRYTMLYRMPKGRPGEQREIRVELSEGARQAHPDARVRARRGYVAPRVVE